MGEPKLRSDPIRCPMGFTVDLYCKYETGDFDHDRKDTSVFGPDRADAMREVKRMGWKIHRDKTATCPSCAAELGAHRSACEP